MRLHSYAVILAALQLPLTAMSVFGDFKSIESDLPLTSITSLVSLISPTLDSESDPLEEILFDPPTPSELQAITTEYDEHITLLEEELVEKLQNKRLGYRKPQ